MLKKLFAQLLNLVYPPFCAHCHEYLQIAKPLCGPCTYLIQPVASITLTLGRHYDMTVYAAGVYDDPLRAMIMAKLHRQTIAAKQLGHIMWEKIIREQHVIKPNSILVPIPLHWTRFAWRGYNQAEEIANKISTLTGIPVMHALKRIRATDSQTHVRGLQRAENVKNAFALKISSLDPSTHIVLVDDLMTTGATLIAAGKVLKSLKPNGIDAIVVARALKK